MGLTNILTDRVKIQLRTATRTAMGETVTWTPVETRHALVIPLDAKARAVYQQMQSQVTHKVVMRDTVTLAVGLNRLKWGSKTLEPVEPPQIVNKETVIMVKEV